MRKEIGAERLLDMHQRNVDFAKKERSETKRRDTEFRENRIRDGEFRGGERGESKETEWRRERLTA